METKVSNASNVLSDRELGRLYDFVAGREEIEAVILFGSVARGEARPDSDLDVGVLLNRKVYEAGFDLLRLIADMSDAFERSDIDVVVLNGASPLLMHQVVRDGHVLYATSNRVVAEFQIYAIQQYEDTRPLRVARQRRLLRRVEERRSSRGISE